MQQNTTDKMNKKVEIVSLGVNCFVRTVLTRNGIKPRKADGELSCPFDLVKHDLPNIIHYLETDFCDYFDDLYFTVVKRNFLDFRKKGKWRKKDGTVFFHDSDCKINDREKLVTRIKNRIINFHQILASKTPIFFIMNLAQNNPKDLNKLYSILKKLCPHKKFKFLVIDFHDLCKESELDEDIILLKLPLPFEKWDSKWNSKKWQRTDFAKYIEKIISDYVQRIIDKEFR